MRQLKVHGELSSKHIVPSHPSLLIGWLHNRTRMIVAMFLTKDLMMDWRLGEKVRAYPSTICKY